MFFQLDSQKSETVKKHKMREVSFFFNVCLISIRKEEGEDEMVR